MSKGGTPSSKSSAAERRVRLILTRLGASHRGEIFLVNLWHSLRLLPASGVRDALVSADVPAMNKMGELSMLAYLRSLLRKPLYALELSNPRTTFAEFSDSGKIVTVMTRTAFDLHYRDSPSSVSGHTATTSPRAGDRMSGYKSDASTAPYFWIASRPFLDAAKIPLADAERLRDALGLVHHREAIPLVAMCATLKSSHPVFRPTVVEAMPNARFRQIDPGLPAEDRWGRTLDLEALSKCPPRIDFSGLAEMLCRQVKLADADGVGFFYLGQTKTDRSTTTADESYLAALNDVDATIVAADKLLSTLFP